MAPRYTYFTTETASPPDNEKSWRLAHATVIKTSSGNDRDGFLTTWNYVEYVWELDSFDEYVPLTAPPAIGPQEDQL